MNRLHRILFTFIVSLSTLLAACSTVSQTPAPKPSIPLEDCPLISARGEQTNARCGILTVPEDRANPSGRKIDLHIAVIPAVSRSPQPDAIFMLAGGPGQSAIETFPAMSALLSNVRQERDIVLVDQRGTGESNPLRCLTPEDEALSQDEARAKLQACPPTLNADLRFYATEIAMTDLDEVRAALGYETINLYGASYGTRAALTYLRMFPNRVRTLTLDAVVDESFVLFQDASRDGQAALDRFFARCESDSACSSAFPKLRSEFDGLLKRLDEAPVEISVAHPLTNHPLDATITRKLVTDMVFNILYVPDLVAMLPLSIHQAYAENYLPLLSQSFLADMGIYDGMFYSVACAEDAPLINKEEAAQESKDSVFGDMTADFLSVCDSWPKGAVSADFRQPIHSNVPTLIYSGTSDPITPPVHADKVAAELSNELHLVFDNMGHGNFATLCGIKIFSDFVKAASVNGLDASCAASVAPPPFFVDFSGPKP
ncbi:MAG: alpha/beta hydrolase [Anaerolineales bacterium]|nr:alpha/beta hydrolase [Anaerolineales bacterium]